MADAPKAAAVIGTALTQGYTLVVRATGPWTVRFETS